VAAELVLGRRGTHLLLQQEKPVTYVESSVVNLRAQEGREVELQGIYEPNTDRHTSLPVLVVQKILSGGEAEKRAESLPSLGITLSVPRAWTAKKETDRARFSASGSALTILDIRKQQNDEVSSLLGKASSSASPALTIGGHTAATVLREQQLTFAAFVQIPASVSADAYTLSFTFALDTRTPVQQQVDDALAILRTVKFSVSSSSARSAPAASASSIDPAAKGKPCGGPAGILCPGGYYCQITEVGGDIGKCTRL
jgi:hypothetical protein